MKTSAVFGCPGTGKSTYLAGLISELVKETSNVCVCSFTRAAAGVLTSRINDRAVRYIGTCHALAFRTLGLAKSAVADVAKFAEWYGADPEDVQISLAVYQHSTQRGIGLAESFIHINPIIPLIRVEHLVQSYINWKNAYQVLDFDDMIRMATGKVEPFDKVVVDEAQDCTDDQWKFILSLVKPDGELYLGGDDDQALYTWNGANPHAMRDLADEVTVLGQSYRIPRVVHRMAEATVKQITERVPKEYLPAAKEGKITYTQHYEPSWYPMKHTVLCRDKWMLQEVENTIIDRGIPYTRNGQLSMFDRSRCALARAVELEDYPTIKRLNKYLLPEYREDTTKACEVGWQKSVDFGTWFKESRYLSLVDPMAEPLIHLSTIHAFKGEEDHHVVLMADCTNQVQAAMDSTYAYDNEVRVWYVGLTRCRESLTIVGWNRFIAPPAH